MLEAQKLRDGASAMSKRSTASQGPVELDIPDGLSDAEMAVEVLRAWIADGSMMLSLSADAFADRTVDWGRLLAEIGQHVARSAGLQGYMPEQEALQAIRKGFEETLGRYQPAMSGDVRGRVKH